MRPQIVPKDCRIEARAALLQAGGSSSALGDNGTVECGPIRHMQKMWRLAHQAGGLKALTEEELDAYVAWLRDRADDHSRDKKARRQSRDGLRAAEAEAVRRRS